MNQTVSFVIFAIGIVICILGGAKVPDEGQTWPSTLGLFIGGMVVAVTGLIAWRKSRRCHKRKRSRKQRRARSGNSSLRPGGSPGKAGRRNW